MNQNSNYLIIDLIGSFPNKSNKSNKINGYYQPTNGILIRDFAIDFFGIDPNNIKILAYGSIKDYDIYVHTNNKCYFQIDLQNIFQMDINKSQIIFDYFTQFDEALKKIEEMIFINEQPKVILFLDDQGFKGCFSQIAYFQLYEIIMKFQNVSFLVFNDSCFSGSFIDLIQSYNYIYTQKIKNNIDEIDLQILFSFYNIFKLFFQKEKVHELQFKVSKLVEFFQNIQIQDGHNDLFNKILKINVANDIDPNDPIENICDCSIDTIKKSGFQKVVDIINFKMIINCCEIEKINSFEHYKNIVNMKNLDLFLNLSNNNLKEFIEKLDVLYIARSKIHFNSEPHKNLEIITSTDNQNKCISFTSLRTNNVTKVYPGSPAMSSFIKEVFMRNHQNSINFTNIENELTEIDGKTLYFPMSIKQQFKTRKHKQWAHFYPKHFKETECDFKLTYTDKMLKKVAALREISFLNVNKLTEIANSLAPADISFHPRPFNDSNADIVAIAGLLNNHINEYNSIISYCFNNNNSPITNHHPQGFDSVSLIIIASFQISQTPLKMVAIIINILEAAAKKAIYDTITLICNTKKTESASEQSESTSEQSENTFSYLFTEKEISKLLEKLKKTQINSSSSEENLTSFYSSISNDEHFKFVFDIEQSIIVLFKPSSILFAILLASYILKEKNLKCIENLSNTYLSSSKEKSFSYFLKNVFCKIDNEDTKKQKKSKENINKKAAEHFLYAHAITALKTVNSICDMQTKIDSMKIVSDQFQQIETFSLIFILQKILKNNNDESFFAPIIDQIEPAINKNNISEFFIPSIIALLPVKNVIQALYLSISNDHNNSYEEVLKMLENIKNNDEYKFFYDDIIILTKKVLRKQKDTKDETKHIEEINKIKLKISKRIQKSISEIENLIDHSIHKARGNISKRININILKSQAKAIINNLPISTNKTKFIRYLNLSNSSLNRKLMLYDEFKINHHEIPKITFIKYESICNSKNIFKRASDELKTVAYLFKMSDISNEFNNKYANKFTDKDATEFSVIAMVARTFNVVEMAPITSILNDFTRLFDPSDGTDPNLRELMGLHSGIIHVLPQKEKMRHRFKLEQLDKEISIKSYENDETDSYYSSDYYEEKDSKSFGSIELEKANEKIISKKALLQYKQFQNEKYKKYQISDLNAAYIRDELKLGHFDWEGDVWKAFIYCFNMRLETIGIQFDPNNDYKKISYPISIINAINTVTQFYPIINVSYIWKNQDRMERFIGQNSSLSKEIIKAFIRAFDDVDRIVTPLYMKRRTYQIRTVNALKLIYDD